MLADFRTCLRTGAHKCRTGHMWQHQSQISGHLHALIQDYCAIFQVQLIVVDRRLNHQEGIRSWKNWRVLLVERFGVPRRDLERVSTCPPFHLRNLPVHHNKAMGPSGAQMKWTPTRLFSRFSSESSVSLTKPRGWRTFQTSTFHGEFLTPMIPHFGLALCSFPG